MPALVEREAIAKVQDLADAFDNAKSYKFPFISRVPKGKAPKQALLVYPVEKYRTPTTAGVIDEAEPTGFQNPREGDAELFARLQIWEEARSVGYLATSVTHQAGITPRQALANAVAKTMIETKADVELTGLSDNESQVEASGAPNLTRGFGKWASSSAQSHYPVDSNYRTPANSITTTAIASIDDSTITTVMKSQYDQCGNEDEENVLFAGSTLKQAFDRLTFSVRDVSNRTMVRRFNESASSTVNLGSTKVIETGFGDLEVQLSQLINTGGDNTSDASKRLGYGSPIDNLEWRWADAPKAKYLAETSRSQRFIVYACGALAVKNPLKLIKFAPSA